MALEHIGIVVSKTAAGLVDIDSAHTLIDGLKVYIAGLGDSTFEEKLKRLEQLTQTPSAIFGDACRGDGTVPSVPSFEGTVEYSPVGNGHDTSAEPLHNGHDVKASHAYNANGYDAEHSAK